MHRTNAIQLRVDAPSKGLLTRVPPDLQDDQKQQYIVAGENVRAERSQLQAAPGYERVHMANKPLDGEPTLIHQPNLTSSDAEVQKIPLVGTEGSLFALKKRARVLTCPTDCTVTFAATADSGRVSGPVIDVAKMIRSWGVDLIVHAGDLIYPDGGTAPGDSKYESQVARHYYWAIGGYDGPFGKGPAINKFFPAIGNHDWNDGPGYKYFEFFNLPGNERNYTIKRGPVQFFFVDSYGYGPASTGPGGNAINGTGAPLGTGSADMSSTGGPALWLRNQLADSDCPWRVVVWHHPPATSSTNYYPGYPVMDWPLGEWGADVLITGHSHVYERIHRADGVLHLVVGNGGKDLYNFSNTPVAGSQVRYNADYGAVKVTASATTFTAKAYSRDGVERDSVTRTTARTLSVCYKGGLAKQADSLKVIPINVSIPKNVAFPLTAMAHYNDGTSADVSKLAAWRSDQTNIATVDSEGKVTGSNVGSASIVATYQGLSAAASVTVLADCSDSKHDITLVLDRSGSMRQRAGNNGTRIERLQTAAGLFLDSLLKEDKVSTISYSDEVKLHHSLTSDFSKSRAAIKTLTANGNTGTAAAVEAAINELKTNGRSDAKKLMVLFTDGFATHAVGCAPNDIMCAMGEVTEWTNLAKGLGITVVVVGLDLLWYPEFEDIVRGWANCPEVYYGIVYADDLAPTFVLLRRNVCVGVCSSGAGVGLGVI